MVSGKAGSIVLVASLTLNAFLLGGIATHHVSSHRTAHDYRHTVLERPLAHRGPGERLGRRGPAEAKLLRDVMHALGGPESPHVREVMAQGRQRMAAHHRRMEDAQASVRQALASEPYDEGRLIAALADLRLAAEVGQKEAQKTLVHLAGQLSAEQRKRLHSSRPEPARPGHDEP